jgi:hypothetical protein
MQGLLWINNCMVLCMAVFFNLGFANSLQGSVRILKLALFLVSRFRQKLNNIAKVPRLEKGWKALVYGNNKAKITYCTKVGGNPSVKYILNVVETEEWKQFV